MQRYNWGFFGTGKVAQEFAKGLKLTPNSNSYSVYSRTYQKALHFAKVFDFKFTHKELDVFLNDPDLDIIYISTPSNLHYEHAIKCLEAGKHVLIEKPFALNAVQAKEIMDTAQRNQLFCMEAMWSRFMPVYREVKKLINNNDLGEIKYFSASFGQPIKYNPNIRQFNLKNGGGCLLDLGVYPISLALMLLGEPEHVSGECRKASSGVDTMASISFHYKNDAIVDLRCSFDCQLPNNLWISGTNGSVNISSPIYRPHQYLIDNYTPSIHSINSNIGYTKREKLHANPHLSRILLLIKNYFLNPFDRFIKTKRKNILSNGYQYEAQEVVNSLDIGKLESSIMPLSDSLTVLKITDILREKWEIRYPEIKRAIENQI